MLTLVHPPPKGQGTDPPKRRPRTLGSLTADERRHLGAALHNLRRAYGTWACLAAVMDLRETTLYHAASRRSPRGSPGIALRAARAGGMSVEAVLTGTLNAAGRCKACGSRIGGGAA